MQRSRAWFGEGSGESGIEWSAKPSQLLRVIYLASRGDTLCGIQVEAEGCQILPPCEIRDVWIVMVDRAQKAWQAKFFNFTHLRQWCPIWRMVRSR